MNKKRKKLELRYIILIVTVIFIILVAILSYSLKTNKKLSTFESIVKDVVVEIQKITYMPVKNFNTVISDYKSLKKVLEENKILKSNVDKIESLEAENNELKQEINDMKNELNIEHVLSDYDYLNATVVSRNASTWYNNLTIDKGSHNGIKEGMVVINSTGVIGKTHTQQFGKSNELRTRS